MRVTIHGKNLEITPAFYTYIEAKLLKPVGRLLVKSSSELPIISLEFGRSTRHHRKGNVYYGIATLTIGRRVIRAEAEAENPRAICTPLKKELELEVKKTFSYGRALNNRSARRIKRELRFDPAAKTFEPKRVRNEGN